ncbi:MAG: NAD-dependent epimerase/dehydratase family protein [Candidatus Eisenbacteria bacterium]
MARALITGVAGFIGSTLAERLLSEGWQVRGLDNFDPYYERAIKERNLRNCESNAAFELHEGDLAGIDLRPLVADVDGVFHLAARPGVRRSWGATFREYVHANVLATQRLLEALVERPQVRLVFASSSSVYGQAEEPLAVETAPRRPISPYGVTKLAGEALVGAYHVNHGIPAVMLRYFTVFGPRQRPDMAMHRFLRALLAGDEIEIYGDGRQTRDFTFIEDAVDATVRAFHRGRPGACYNIGGGSPASVLEVIEILAAATGRRPRSRLAAAQPGDPRSTRADVGRARADLDFRPRVGLEEGLHRMTAWMAQVGMPAPAAGTNHESA